MKRLLPFLLILSASAQTLPKWAGCGPSFANPGWLGWCAMAVPAIQSQGIYSYTMYQFLPNGGKTPTVSTTTGGAIILRTWHPTIGRIDILGLGTVGVATTSTATTGAFSGGAVAVFTSKRGWTMEAGGIENKAGASPKPQWIAGPGLTW
jgi:hypothetical protein